MQTDSSAINLNFFTIEPGSFDVCYFRRLAGEVAQADIHSFFQREQTIAPGRAGSKSRFAITFDELQDFERVVQPSVKDLDLTKRFLLELLKRNLEVNKIRTLDTGRDKYRRIHLSLNDLEEGTETIWLEPYYLRAIERFGFLVDYKFWVSSEYREKIGRNVDRRVLQLSGALDSRGNSNREFYQFRFRKLQQFLNRYFPFISAFQSDLNKFTISEQLLELSSDVLATKTYQFADGGQSNSPWFGLLRHGPYDPPPKPCKFLFVFRDVDRSFAINLWNGLTGKASPTTFPGIESVFRLPFSNDYISGRKVDQFTPEIIAEIADEIANSSDEITLPVFITKAHETAEDDRLYYTIKHAFTKRNIPCQVVTKELIVNKTSLRYSLSNIALQIFAKCGGKPWIVKPAIKDCLIIGIGSSHQETLTIDEFGYKKRIIERYLTYSVLTDSSGLFREIEVLSDAENETDYYQQLSRRLIQIITEAAQDGTKEIVVHAPFKISKSKVWNQVFAEIPADVKISILIINSDHKFFGWDFAKNSLIPYESTFISLSHYEFLVWFEGLQYQTSSLTKRIGGPIYVNFWHANNQAISNDFDHRRSLLQDCINLSGANWRGFKAKQLPVSIFYCQRIADFLKNFDRNGFESIEFENLRPWFL